MKIPGLITPFLSVLLFFIGVHTAAAGDGDKVYAAMRGDAGVAVIDPRMLDAWGAIKSGKANAKLKASPDGRSLYVSVNGENKVKCIDTSSDEVVKEVETGDSPYAMDLTPDGKLLLVCNDQGGSLSIIDTGPFKELKRISLGGSPQAVKVSPDGKKAYLEVGDPEAELVVIDMKRLELVKRFKLPGRVYNLELSPGGDRLYVQSLEVSTILVIETSTMKVVDRISSHEQYGMVLSRDGKEIWFAGPIGKLIAYSIPDKKVIAELPCDNRNCSDPRITFSPAGKLVFAGPAGAECSVLEVYDADKKIKTGEIKLPGRPDGVVYLAR